MVFSEVLKPSFKSIYLWLPYMHLFPRSRQTYVYGYVAQLWPAQGMVHVVFAKVVFGQVRNVRLLDVRDIGELKYADIHGGGMDDRISDGVKLESNALRSS